MVLVGVGVRVVAVGTGADRRLRLAVLRGGGRAPGEEWLGVDLWCHGVVLGGGSGKWFPEFVD